MPIDVVEIEATNRCNTRCLHCPREAITRPIGTMSWRVFQTIADKLLAYRRIRAVDFCGMGEPTLNPLLPRFVTYLSDKVSTFMTTNVSTLTSSLIQALVDAGLENVILSFSGHNAETYGVMSGGLSFESAEARVRDLVRLGDKIHVSANVSVTLLSRRHLSAIKDHLNRLGVHDILFSMCHSRGGHLVDPSICDTPMPPIQNGRCDLFTNTLFVAWDGQVLACCHDLQGKGKIGDLGQDDLDRILEKRQSIMQKGVQFPMCENCNDMYRFARDLTPDGRPLSEWNYMLAGSQEPGVDRLMEVIRRQEAHIQELRQVIAGYERGRFIRFMRWLHEARQKIGL